MCFDRPALSIYCPGGEAKQGHRLPRSTLIASLLNLFPFVLKVLLVNPHRQPVSTMYILDCANRVYSTLWGRASGKPGDPLQGDGIQPLVGQLHAQTLVRPRATLRHCRLDNGPGPGILPLDMLCDRWRETSPALLVYQHSKVSEDLRCGENMLLRRSRSRSVHEGSVRPGRPLPMHQYLSLSTKPHNVRRAHAGAVRVWRWLFLRQMCAFANALSCGACKYSCTRRASAELVGSNAELLPRQRDGIGLSRGAWP